VLDENAASHSSDDERRCVAAHEQYRSVKSRIPGALRSHKLET
jgi:hypothetical protein